MVFSLKQHSYVLKIVSLVFLISMVSFFFTLPSMAQERSLDEILMFETPATDGLMRYWGGGPAETIFLDSAIVYTGTGSLRIARDGQSTRQFSTLTKKIPVDFDGKTIQLRGFLRADSVEGSLVLWMRQDGPGGPVQFTNMMDRAVIGTSDWTLHSIELPLDPEAKDLFFGVLLGGTGTGWADDLELLVDGKPLEEAPTKDTPLTVLDTDQEFASGSGIEIGDLSSMQIENLAVLGRVWGFLKYHHPRITAGEFHWDFELFRILPDVLAAPDAATRNAVLADWVEDLLGIPTSCDECAKAPSNIHLQAETAWLADEHLLGASLSEHLSQIYAFRIDGSEHFYLGKVVGVGNPIFRNESNYAELTPLDDGYRMLSLFRFWTIIKYWFPYRDQLDDDWNEVLQTFIPRFIEAPDWDAYQLTLMALIARVHDTHANLWSSLAVRPPVGDCFWPIGIRFIENKAVVTQIVDAERTAPSGLQIGDVIEAIDGEAIDTLVDAWAPYYAVSNRPTLLRDIGRQMPRGSCGVNALQVNRDGKQIATSLERFADIEPQRQPHDRAGETFQMLSDDVAYLKLSSISINQLSGYLEQAAGTRGLVIDIRNYPSEFVVFALGMRLVDGPTPFARFTIGDLSNPGVFTWTTPISLQPSAPRYEGRVAILIDEVSQSQSEYTSMALRAGPNAVVIGSTTAGADGNVSMIPMPGGLRAMISGIGVFYPDKTPTQRVGIIPDIEVRPTIEGIRSGRDEVLESAVRHILGPEADEGMIRAMAASPAH